MWTKAERGVKGYLRNYVKKMLLVNPILSSELVVVHGTQKGKKGSKTVVNRAPHW